MNKQHRSSSGSTNLASCVVATIFIIFIIIILLILFFTLFKPQTPQISVTSIQVPSFSLSNNTITFTLSQYVSVRNPNRADFTHYHSSLQLMYSGNQIGFMFIPAGKIDSGRTQYMSATFTVDDFPLLPPSSTSSASTMMSSSSSSSAQGVAAIGPSLEIESRMKMSGRVRVLQVFTHSVDSSITCVVAVSVSDRSILGFHC
ncbi:hypothetical protein MKW94_024020 [Papaver nudicaule]|uniref:Late embryogenesis abundant protein LEA-2 subgroup domain-containing protein n=1 Tax=Papaver nudicaule TaxID=74823 RepID=A0AA41VFL0_PAPNU|nr:hypothetical protein [Papaver nudicaule]